LVEKVYSKDVWLLVTFRAPIRIDCARAEGLVLTRYGKTLSSVPLEAAQQKQLCHADVVLAIGSQVTPFMLSDCQYEELAAWLDLERFVCVSQTESLGEAVVIPTAGFVETDIDVRNALGVKPPPNESQALLQALTHKPAHPLTKQTTRFSLWALLKAWFAQRKQTSSSPSRALTSSFLPAVRPQEPLLLRFGAALKRMFSQALFSSKLAQLIGRKHAAYLSRMLEMFDANQLDQALRHAIPLVEESQAGDDSVFPLRALTPRTELAIVPGKATGKNSLNLGGDLFELLRQHYRRAFERLVALGDWEKAAFVLAELLNAHEEAVTFLERHRKFRLAAEIAEARKLAPGLVIRQWFLAGERKRAIQIAQQTGAFADALFRLEHTDENAARALRLLWADKLASAGAYAAAVDVVWPVVEARGLAANWLDHAIDVGGVTGARMLERKVSLVPESFPEIRDRVVALLEDDDAEQLPRIIALANALLCGSPTAETRAIAKAVARRLLRECELKEYDRLVERLLLLCGDAVLLADVKSAKNLERSNHSAAGKIQFTARAGRLKGTQRFYYSDTFIISTLKGVAQEKSALTLSDVANQGVVIGVFDGQGGLVDSPANACSHDVAREMITTLRAHFMERAFGDAEVIDALTLAFEKANQNLFAKSQVDANYKGSGCTAAVAVLCGPRMFVGHVGDCRAYLLRGQTLLAVTRDHTLLNEYRVATDDSKKAIDSEALASVPPNVLTRVLGTSEKIIPDIIEVELQSEDTVLLCSNGLWQFINDDTLCEVLTSKHKSRAACDALIGRAIEAGPLDDLTLVVAKVEGKGLPRAQPGAVGIKRCNDQTLPKTQAKPKKIWRARADRGACSIKDAAELPDGKMILALGELGVWLIARDGHVLTRWAEPADRIVLSDHGDRAILLARRGESYRVARLDLITKRVRSWCDARFQQFAPDFDGFCWFVAHQNTVYAIDATAEGWEHLWKVSEHGAQVCQVRRTPKTCALLLYHSAVQAEEIWTYELPAYALRQRKLIDQENQSTFLGAISASGDYIGTCSETKVMRTLRQGILKDIDVPAFGICTAPNLSAEWAVTSVPNEEGTTLHVIDWNSLNVTLTVHFESAGPLQVGNRIQGNHLIVFDGVGRVLVISLTHGRVVREHHFA